MFANFYGGRALAAFGADVMLVNSPHLPNIEAIADTSRGKRSCHVDLRQPRGQAEMDQLLASSHVYLQGYRPGRSLAWTVTRRRTGAWSQATARPATSRSARSTSSSRRDSASLIRSPQHHSRRTSIA